MNDFPFRSQKSDTADRAETNENSGTINTNPRNSTMLKREETPLFNGRACALLERPRIISLGSRGRRIMNLKSKLLKKLTKKK